MKSLKELYKIGCGPSSSHTIGPERACEIFKTRNPHADRFGVVLYGSLAKTGKGHCTDKVIQKTFFPKECEIAFNADNSDIPHPNTLELIAYVKGKESDRARVFSVGGGSIVFEGDAFSEPEDIYPETHFEDVAAICKNNDKRLWEYVVEKEGNDLKIGMDSKLLLDALKAIEHQEAIFEFNTVISPCVIKPIEGDSFVYMVLPSRI
jgi:L-serine dehydratase